MPITSLERDYGVRPSIVRMLDTDDFSTITAAGYLFTQLQVIYNLCGGPFTFLDSDLICIKYSDGINFFTLNQVTGTFTLNSSGGGSGTVGPGVINELAWYPATGTEVDGLSPAVASAVLVSDADTTPIWSSTMTDGQIIVGSTGGTPMATTLTEGSGITITNGAGEITITSTGGGGGTVGSGLINELAWYAADGTAVEGLSPAVASAVLVSDSSDTPVWSSTMTDGQVIIGSTGATPVAAPITAGTGINIANAAGSITVTNTAQGLSFVNQTTSTNLVANTLNFVNGGASLVTLTLPTITTAGDTFTILGYSAGGWQVNKGGATSIQFGNTSSSIGIASSNQFDCITITIVNPTLSVVGIVYGVQGAPTPL